MQFLVNSKLVRSIEIILGKGSSAKSKIANKFKHQRYLSTSTYPKLLKHHQDLKARRYQAM